MTSYEIVDRPTRDELGEAPFWSQTEQVLYWVDIVGKRVHRLDPANGRIQSWTTPQYVSGAVPTRRGDLIAALAGGLYRLDRETGAVQPFARPDQDAGNRSNECRADPQGRLWLGTMQNNLGPDGEALDVTRNSGGVFCVRPDGGSSRMIADVGIVNIFCWSPDGTRFYTADSRAGVIRVYDYDPDGPTISNGRVFVGDGPGTPDGSSMDEAGCLWTVRWGGSRVIRYTPDGRVDREIPMPVKQPSSCAFGGADRKTLYVTSARHGLDDPPPDSLDGSLFAVQLDVAGLPMTPFAG